VLKQRTARALLPQRKRKLPRQRNLFGDEPQRRAFWPARFYDFNVRTTKKRVEKLRYMHRNPVNGDWVETPEQWRWSSYRFYLLDEAGPVRVNEGWTKISFRDRTA
jgi:REP element-mobilizing transposase RayT